MENQEIILSIIPKIKVPYLATINYWSIIRTNKAIYFVKSAKVLGLDVGFGPLLMLIGTIGDFLASRKIKKYTGKDINTILSETDQYFRFSEEEFNQIQAEKGIFGGKIILPSGKEKSWKESGIIKLKLSSSQYKTFFKMLDKNFIVSEFE